MISTRYTRGCAAALLTLSLIVGSALQARAGDPPAAPVPPVDTASIFGNSFGNAHGSLDINEAAGNGNVQSNVTVVAHGPLRVPLTQKTNATGSGGGESDIGDFAFYSATGVVQLNIAAGTGNAQGNAAIVRIGVPATEMSDGALAAALPVQQTNPNSQRAANASDAVNAAASAFAHSKGVVQINQSAGAGNSTANSLLLQIQSGVAH